jgi:bifunctional DNase/RNase
MTETSSQPANDLPVEPPDPQPDPRPDETPAPAAPEAPIPAVPVPEAVPVVPVTEAPDQVAGSVEEAPANPASMAGYRMAIVSSVTVDLPVQHPTVVLRETESPRRQLSFSVGLQDGIAISHALRRIPTPRPLTHELMADILQAFDIDVVAVRLVGRQGSTYFAEVDLRGPNGRSVHSSRPSDAVAIALRQPVPVPILIDSRLFEVLGDVAPL